MRVVSLLSSATEIMCALEAGEFLVGRSHECDTPPWVRSLPACSEPAFDISVSSGEIDREVNRRIRAGEPLYRIHTGRIRALAPDLIIAQSHCEVCAVTPGDVERSGAFVPGARVLELTAASLDGIFASMVEVARAVGLETRGHELVARERARLDRLRAITAPLRRPSIVMLEWADPVFPMGNWGPELVDAANGDLLLGKRGQHSSAIASGQVKAADPEYLVVAPCGFALERAARELPVLERYPWWNALRAVRTGKVAFADGNLFFNRSGMTITRSAEILAEILHGVISAEPAQGRHWLWMKDARGAGVSAA
ncbi:MAG: ABC transporter substrate-binding protein [Acidobacteria bacterium]|nr:ABC transporter substrate-binding protein [Acidobacteriota bacterium]MBI3280756.1 ABC transporter substrate-binding protein [Acidobacteriota bacterium]